MDVELVEKTKNMQEPAKAKLSLTDEELISRFQDGDVYAFEQIVHRYKAPLVNFIYNYLGNRIDAEDVTQEVFLKAYRILSTTRPLVTQNDL